MFDEICSVYIYDSRNYLVFIDLYKLFKENPKSTIVEIIWPL